MRPNQFCILVGLEVSMGALLKVFICALAGADSLAGDKLGAFNLSMKASTPHTPHASLCMFASPLSAYNLIDCPT